MKFVLKEIFGVFKYLYIVGNYSHLDFKRTK